MREKSLQEASAKVFYLGLNMYIFFFFRIFFVCKASHTPLWLCRHTAILILLQFMFHSLHIREAVCTELQPTSRLVNSSLEVLLHLGQLCSAEVQHKMMGFKTAPMATQQKFSPNCTKAGLWWTVTHCNRSGLTLFDIPGQVGQGLEQLDLGESVLAYDRGLE